MGPNARNSLQPAAIIIVYVQLCFLAHFSKHSQGSRRFRVLLKSIMSLKGVVTKNESDMSS